MMNLEPVFPCRSIKHIDDLLQNTRWCRVCGTGNDNLAPMIERESPPLYVIVCGFCDNMGPKAPGLEDAVKAWNQAQQ